MVFLAIPATSLLTHHPVAFWISLLRRGWLENCAAWQFPYKAKLRAQPGLAIPFVFSLHCKNRPALWCPLYQSQSGKKNTEFLFFPLLNASWRHHLKGITPPPKNKQCRERVMFVPLALPTNNSLQTLQRLSLYHMFVQRLTPQSSAPRPWSLGITVMEALQKTGRAPSNNALPWLELPGRWAGPLLIPPRSPLTKNTRESVTTHAPAQLTPSRAFSQKQLLFRAQIQWTIEARWQRRW